MKIHSMICFTGGVFGGKSLIVSATTGMAAMCLLGACKEPTSTFSGRIKYCHSFVLLNDSKPAPSFFQNIQEAFGPMQTTYITDGRYKVCGEQGQLKQLYDNATNRYQLFESGRPVKSLDAATATAVQLIHLPDTTTVLGYPCKALQLIENGVRTVYFYTPKLAVRASSFKQHALMGWAQYMQATNGGLTLKYIISDPRANFTMTSEATEITPMQLSSADFTPGAPTR
jgi:hypothetical protein